MASSLNGTEGVFRVPDLSCVERSPMLREEKVSPNATRAEALRRLGNSYSLGLGVVPDHAKAVRLWEEAAHLKNSRALYSLARCYMRGESVPKRPGKALHLFMRSAKKGNVAAIEYLAQYFITQQGVSARIKKLWWLIQKYRDSLAMNDLACYYFKGTKGVAKNFELAATLWKTGAILGNFHATKNLAQCYLIGSGVRKDSEKGMFLLSLAFMLEKGTVGPKSSSALHIDIASHHVNLSS